MYVTGVGAVGAHGTDSKALAAMLSSGEPRLAPIPDDGSAAAWPSEGPSEGRRGVVCPPDLDLRPWLPRSARRMSRSSRFAVAAARLALADAGEPEIARDDSVIACATAMGPSAFTEKIATTIIEASPLQVSPFQFTECVASAPAGQIAIDTGIRGGNWTTCQREAGSVLTLLRVADEIRRGNAVAGVAATVDEAPVLLHRMLDRFRAVSRPTAPGGEAARPFDRARDGFLLGEGATACWLELGGYGTARRRAELVAGVRAFDPSAPPHDYGCDAEGLAQRLRDGLERASVPRDSIECVVSCAAGSRRGDRLEAGVLRATFGTGLPPVVTPKAVVGEYGMGTVGAAVLLLGGVPIARPTACSWPDPELGVVSGGWMNDTPPRRVLLTALSTGGAAAWAILDRCDERN